MSDKAFFQAERQTRSRGEKKRLRFILLTGLAFFGWLLSVSSGSAKDLPDLVIELVTWSPQFPQDLVNYENTRFKITVRNIGKATASNFSITVALDDMHVASEWVKFLPPGKCITVETKSRLTRSPGSHPVVVKVDGNAETRLAKMNAPMNNMVAESNENNNWWYGTITYLPQGTSPLQGFKPFPAHTCTDVLEPETKPRMSEPETEPKLSGFVRDAVTGNTVTGATVDLGGSVKVTADHRGRYIIKTLNFNPGAIVVTASGYHPFRKENPIIDLKPQQMDFYINPLGSESTIDVGGETFMYFDAQIKRFLKSTHEDGSAYQIGSYEVGSYRGEGGSFGYSITLYARNHFYFFSNPMNTEYRDAARTSLNCYGASYAPVRVFKKGSGKEATIGHFFINKSGNILTQDSKIEALYTAIHALGDQNSFQKIDAAIQDFKDLRQELFDKRSKFSDIVGWGIALRAIDDTFAIVTGIASGDLMGTSGAIFTLADSVAFYNKLIAMKQQAADPSKTFPDWDSVNTYVIAPLKISHTAVSSVADLWPLAKAIVWKQSPHNFLDEIFMSWSWNDAWKTTLKKNKGKIGMTMATQVAELIKMIEDPDALTEKALGWEIQTCGLTAMVNKVIQVLTDAKDGVGSLKELDGLQNLKYNCAQIAYSYGKLTQDVFQEIENRKKSTISGWLYSRFKPVWNQIIFNGSLPSGSELQIVQEIAKRLSGYIDGSGNFVKGSSQCMAEAFFDDLKLTALQKAWTMTRIKEKAGTL
ncbi:MAG: hypothetical protein JXB23_08010 [Candidatus Aminicenantes bacterium]|nr:hypothetical protein [Candidatus Aminicenantes bacterium]